MHSLLKHRQIRHSHACAIATAHLLRRVVAVFRITDVAKLIERVQQVGQRLVIAQPTELAVGNIIRRVLGVIRDEAEENREGEAGASETVINQSEDSEPKSKGPSRSNALSNTSNTSYAATSLFSLLSQSQSKATSPLGTPRTQSPGSQSASALPIQPKSHNSQDLRAEVIEGIQEIIDELNQADDQIAGYAQDHIHSDDVILTYTSSVTVQKFLLKAATRRKFTVVYADASTNDHQLMHLKKITSTGDYEEVGDSERFQKALTAAGVTVVLLPFSAVFAIMSRVDKVILSSHVMLADGSLVATAGAKLIVKAAKMHRTPVVVLGGVYKLNPTYPFNPEALIEFGDPSSITAFGEGDMIGKIDVESPLLDHVPADHVDLYITNLFVTSSIPRQEH